MRSMSAGGVQLLHAYSISDSISDLYKFIFTRTMMLDFYVAFLISYCCKNHFKSCFDIFGPTPLFAYNGFYIIKNVCLI
jgi:hypothetical protein